MTVSVEVRHEDEALQSVVWKREFEFQSVEDAETYLYQAGFYEYSCESFALDVQTQAVVFK